MFVEACFVALILGALLFLLEGCFCKTDQQHKKQQINGENKMALINLFQSGISLLSSERVSDKADLHFA